MWPRHVTSWKGPASRHHTHGPGSDRAPRWARRAAREWGDGRGAEAATSGPARETAVVRRPTQARRPRPRFSQPRRRCQGDRRRRFPRRAPPPGQSDRRSPEPRFSLFRSHFRPRTGAAPLRQKARAPEASGMVWDRVGGVRVRGRGGGAEAAERAPTRYRAEGDEARLPALLDPARPFGARRRRRGSKPNSCRPGRPEGPGRGGWRPRAWEVGPEAGRRLSGRAGAAPIGPHRARTRGRRSLSQSSHTSISATS